MSATDKDYDISNINNNYRKIISKNNTVVKKILFSFFAIYFVVGFSYDLIVKIIGNYGKTKNNMHCLENCTLSFGDIFLGLLNGTYLPVLTILFMVIAIFAVLVAKYNYKNIMFSNLDYWMIKQEGDRINVSDDSTNDIYRDIKSSGDKEIQYLNIIDEMVIASSLKFKPDAYIYVDSLPNAFSMSSGNQGFIAISSGALEILSRDEISAMVAHEIGHLKYEDNQIAYYVDTLIHTLDFILEMIQDVSGRLFSMAFTIDSSSSFMRNKVDFRSSFYVAIFYLFTFFLRIIFPIVAVTLKTFLDEATDFRADALSMKYTRNPLALYTLLKRQNDYDFDDNSGRSHSSFFPGDDFSPIPMIVNISKPPERITLKRLRNLEKDSNDNE